MKIQTRYSELRLGIAITQWAWRRTWAGERRSRLLVEMSDVVGLPLHCSIGEAFLSFLFLFHPFNFRVFCYIIIVLGVFFLFLFFFSFLFALCFSMREKAERRTDCIDRLTCTVNGKVQINGKKIRSGACREWSRDTVWWR